jgi:hypothetical protein
MRAEENLDAVRPPERLALGVNAALRAIATTGKGRCWYCDDRLPRAAVAIRTGWYVQRIEGERVASIILVCPNCLSLKAEWGEEEFHRRMAQRFCNVTA